MELLNIISDFGDFFKEMFSSDLRTALTHFVEKHDILTYGLLCTIIFCETGLVVTPFLPGDSLLFAAGAVAGSTAQSGIINPFLLITLLILAALAGDNVNYFVGRFIGEKISGMKILGITVKQEYIQKTHNYYQKYGPRTIIIARFVPIVRTFAPFVAGVGKMSYIRYIFFCFLGAVMWVASITTAGFLLGTNEWVQHNFEKVVIIIIVISLLPVIYSAFKGNIKK